MWRRETAGAIGFPVRTSGSWLQRWPWLILPACGILPPTAGSIVSVFPGDRLMQCCLRENRKSGLPSSPSSSP